MIGALKVAKFSQSSARVLFVFCYGIGTARMTTSQLGL